MNTIKAKYAEYVLVPKEGLSGIEPGAYETADGKTCFATFIAGWDNRGGVYDEQLDHICQKRWNLPFSYIKSLWMERCWEIEGYWYLLMLRESGT